MTDETPRVIPEHYSWTLERSRFLGVTPAILRDRAEWQAAFLANLFGPEALTGMAIYFGQLGQDLMARMLQRDRETAQVVAEQDEELRSKYSRKSIWEDLF